MANTSDFFKEKKGWSLLKDMIIDDYLKPYISKVLRLYKPLHIIDCFAGKGKFDDGLNGSPIIIANRIKEVLENQNNEAYPNKKIFGYFIEKKYADDLEKNMAGYENCQVLKGTYEENIKKLVDNEKLNEFSLFLYVDPYGVKSLDFIYFEKLKEKNYPSLEILMNFTVSGFLRAGCRLLKYEIFDRENEELIEDETEEIQKWNQIAGGDYWQKIIENYYNKIISWIDAEEYFVLEYADKLKEIFKYVINIPIREKSGHTPKYRLFFGTNHPDGLILMADEMNKAWKKFEEMEKLANPQISLEELFEFPDMRLLKGYNPEVDIKNILSCCLEIDLKEIYVNMILKYGLSYSKKEYEELLKDMEKAGLIEVLRNPPTTPKGKMSTSWDYNYKESIKIRLKNDTHQN
jgi:three-Cys-motif partner protein